MERKYLDKLEQIYNVTEAKLDVLTTYEQRAVTTATPGHVNVKDTNAETITIITILCFFSVIGTLGNGLVLYVFTRTPSKLTSTIFILALAGTDFVTCLITIPFTVITIYVDYYLMYDVACKIYQFLITCVVPLSAFIMVAIAVDRYICICHPFAHLMTVKRAKIIVGILVAFAVILGLITSLGFSTYANVTDQNIERNYTASSVFLLLPENSTRNISIEDYPRYIASDSNTQVPIDLPQGFPEGQCTQRPTLVSIEFSTAYQKVYSSFYLCSLLIVLFLYSLIYSSVTRQRAKRRAQKNANRVKQVNMQCQTDECTMPLTNLDHKQATNAQGNHGMTVEMDGETVCTKLSPTAENGNAKSQSKPLRKTLSVRRQANGDHQKDKRDHDRLANIKTAVMLFIVTIVFIIAFLPAWLMAHMWLKFNSVVFYMYFVYNVANPVIYAFMNQMFRDNMCRMFGSCRMFIRSGS